MTDNAKDREIAALKARINELEAELARSAKKQAGDSVITKHRTGGDTARIRELEADIRVLKAEIARERGMRERAEEKASPPDERIVKLEAQLRKYSTKIDGLQLDMARLQKSTRGSLTAVEFNKLLMLYHADRKPTDAEKNEAFIILRKMKPYWVKERMKTVTEPPPMPESTEDFDAWRRRKKEQDTEKRAAKKAAKT